jgi:hypothetical protein
MTAVTLLNRDLVSEADVGTALSIFRDLVFEYNYVDTKRRSSRGNDAVGLTYRLEYTGIQSYRYTRPRVLFSTRLRINVVTDDNVCVHYLNGRLFAD